RSNLVILLAKKCESSTHRSTAHLSGGRRDMSYFVAWVKVEKYAELTGDSVDAVNARRKAGKWLDGNQCKIVDGRLWVNLSAAEEWVEKWQPNRQMSVA